MVGFWFGFWFDLCASILCHGRKEGLVLIACACAPSNESLGLAILFRPLSIYDAYIYLLWKNMTRLMYALAALGSSHRALKEKQWFSVQAVHFVITPCAQFMTHSYGIWVILTALRLKHGLHMSRKLGTVQNCPTIDLDKVIDCPDNAPDSV